MKKVALIFPGQGSQTVGMGRELYDTNPTARAIFDQAEQVIPGLLDVIFNGPEDKLKETAYCQPAIVTVSVAALKAFEQSEQYSTVTPVFACGHSLGELSALVACGALSFEAVINLVQKRAACMQKAAEANPGKMAAVIGVEASVLLDICRDNGSEVANFNSLDQIVITGAADKVDATCKVLEAQGARVIPLAVSGGFHSSLMKSAADEFQIYVDQTDFAMPKFPLLCNVDATPTTDISEIKFNLPKQIYSSVFWVDTIQTIVSAGVTDFIEIGPGTVLKGLLRKIDKSLSVQNIRTPEDIAAIQNS
ncbi:MAG: ACP S-malonyltransferase [Candidatus Omnitrophica bacterium]|nr:ACP S-malonyltransferase [Candidatus Omnitrophota bacterium]